MYFHDFESRCQPTWEGVPAGFTCRALSLMSMSGPMNASAIAMVCGCSSKSTKTSPCRRDGKDDVGRLSQTIGPVCGVSGYGAQPVIASLFFNPLEFLLHARKESILQDGIQMKVALGVEGVILGFIEANIDLLEVRAIPKKL